MRTQLHDPVLGAAYPSDSWCRRPAPPPLPPSSRTHSCTSVREVALGRCGGWDSSGREAAARWRGSCRALEVGPDSILFPQIWVPRGRNGPRSEPTCGGVGQLAAARDARPDASRWGSSGAVQAWWVGPGWPVWYARSMWMTRSFWWQTATTTLSRARLILARPSEWGMPDLKMTSLIHQRLQRRPCHVDMPLKHCDNWDDSRVEAVSSRHGHWHPHLTPGTSDLLNYP